MLVMDRDGACARATTATSTVRRPPSAACARPPRAATARAAARARTPACCAAAGNRPDRPGHPRPRAARLQARARALAQGQRRAPGRAARRARRPRGHGRPRRRAPPTASPRSSTTLERNSEWWSTGPLLSSGARVSSPAAGWSGSTTPATASRSSGWARSARPTGCGPPRQGRRVREPDRRGGRARRASGRAASASSTSSRSTAATRRGSRAWRRAPRSPRWCARALRLKRPHLVRRRAAGHRHLPRRAARGRRADPPRRARTTCSTPSPRGCTSSTASSSRSTGCSTTPGSSTTRRAGRCSPPGARRPPPSCPRYDTGGWSKYSEYTRVEPALPHAPARVPATRCATASSAAEQDDRALLPVHGGASRSTSRATPSITFAGAQTALRAKRARARALLDRQARPR